jgi:hypothetical protein
MFALSWFLLAIIRASPSACLAASQQPTTIASQEAGGHVGEYAAVRGVVVNVFV